MTIRFVQASGFWLWLLNIIKCDGLTMPWGRIYIRPSCINDRELLEHELVHIEQIERDGPVKFSILYLYYLARYGYLRSPYEIEAYQRTSPEYHKELISR